MKINSEIAQLCRNRHRRKKTYFVGHVSLVIRWAFKRFILSLDTSLLIKHTKIYRSLADNQLFQAMPFSINTLSTNISGLAKCFNIKLNMPPLGLTLTPWVFSRRYRRENPNFNFTNINVTAFGIVLVQHPDGVKSYFSCIYL